MQAEQYSRRASSKKSGSPIRIHNYLRTVVTDDPTAENPDPANSNAENAEPEKREPRPLRLDQFLQLCGAADTGGRAKVLIQGGDVRLNGVVETRRRKQLASGDVIKVFDAVLPVDEYFTAG